LHASQATVQAPWQTRQVTRDPGSSYASETRQMVRRERLSLGLGGGGGPSGLVVVVVVLIVVAAVVWVSVR
jgi:hypothetical protein